MRTAAVMELVVRGHSIKTTAEHPFYVPLQGKFIAAGELKAGDELVGHSGELVRIDTVSPLGEVATVYERGLGKEAWGHCTLMRGRMGLGRRVRCSQSSSLMR